MRKLVWSRIRDDFEITYYSGTGKGGQNRNRHRNAVRIKDIETGLTASCEEQRSLAQNKKTAFRRLAKLLINHYFPKQGKNRFPSAQTIRTYNESSDRVVDHQTGKKYSYKQIIDDISQALEDRAKLLGDKK